MTRLISTNPANNYNFLWEVEISNDKEIQKKINDAIKARQNWRYLWVKKRIKFLIPVYEEFIQNKEDLAKLISHEMWKPLNESLSEITWYLEDFKWFLENVENAIKDEITHEDKNYLHKIIYEPTWVAWVIAPWNYPFWMAVWGIIPNLLVWNTVVFKTSEECPLVWKYIEGIFNKHNLPKWVFSEIYWAWDVWEKLIKSNINLIWFTWSTKTWQYLYKIAAEKFIKVILELGWSDPCIVFEDIDVKKYAMQIYNARFRNCWQVCTALKRLIVHESIYDELIDELTKIIKSKKVWNPLNPETDMWPLVAERQVKLLEEQLQDAMKKWAKVIIWWERIKSLKWAYFKQTLITNINNDMKVWKEEVFWPILPIIKFKTQKEAIKLANDTIYWLTARIITNNLDKAEKIALDLECWSVKINDASRWETANPFWWYKKSWMWREHWIIWFRELCQIKTFSTNKKSS